VTTSFFRTVFPSDTAIRHFSLGRHALVEAFSALELKAGDKVLMPEYVCRDLLAALFKCDLQPVWYAVDHDFSPILDSHDWPFAQAVLAINYFGFPQSLTPFYAYAKRSGATIIEDNAHGFLSRDQQGTLLGTRAPLGLFSYRKTFLIGRGAGLAVNRPELTVHLHDQLPNAASSMPIAVRVRRNLYRIFGSRAPGHILAHIIRRVRKLQGKSQIPLPTPHAEYEITESANPDAFMLPALDKQDLEGEIQRRRCLYLKLLTKAQEMGLPVVYPELPANTVPYGLAVRSDNLNAIAQLAAGEHLDFFKWPDLPGEVLSRAPKHYCDVYLINFL
jgi:hypothetical protein